MICVCDKSATLSWTCPGLCRGLCHWLSPMHCNGLNSIRATQTGLSRSCHGLCRKHLDMSRWPASVTFVICVSDFHRNFMVSWCVTVCVCDFHDFMISWWLSLRKSFGESRCNGIWALAVIFNMMHYINSRSALSLTYYCHVPPMPPGPLARFINILQIWECICEKCIRCLSVLAEG